MIPFLRTDVTAVNLQGDFILTGIGSNVSIFNRHTCGFLQTIKALMGQKIHGFTARDDGATIVYGGKQFCVIRLDKRNREVEIVEKSEVIHCDDWIWHTAWMNVDEIAVLTAHNVVQIWNIISNQMTCKYTGKENSIMYSGLMHLLDDGVLVFAGTVFSKVIIHQCGVAEPLQTLKGHKGVIFSIAFSAAKELIVTTSDDRSVRLWGPNTRTQYSPNQTEYWEECIMACRNVVYGHLSRVMGCVIAPSAIISVGEDSNVCFWDCTGKLLRSLRAHQNGCIWSVCADATHIVTGGSDGAVILHPMSLLDHSQCDMLRYGEDLGVPKRIMYTSRGNIVAYFANDDLQYYDVDSQLWQPVISYDKTYKMIDMSPCRQMVGVVDVHRNLDVFVESCKNTPKLTKLFSRKLTLGKVCSLHWVGNRFLAICSDDGSITVVASDCDNLRSFLLPPCRERWLTAAAVNPTQDLFVFGDRCGNLHFYNRRNKAPLQTFRKIHGPYGPTTITWKGISVVTTGRDGTIKSFSVNDNGGEVTFKQMDQINLPFKWIERTIREDGLVCGFNEKNFIVYNIKDCRAVIEMGCGGGHRAWDINRCYNKVKLDYEEIVQFVYVKKTSVYQATFQLDKITSKTVISGSHGKEINCLAMIPFQSHLKSGAKEIFFVTGGEDTTIRISSRSSRATGLEFCDRLILKQLSSTRTIGYSSLQNGKILLVSGGGRAKMCVRVVNFSKSCEEPIFDLEVENIVEYQVKHFEDTNKSNKPRKNDIDVDTETRIMSLKIYKDDVDEYVILAGCSDSILRVFRYNHSHKRDLKLCGEIKYHKTCILIVHYFKLHGSHCALTATTTGETALWNFPNLDKTNEQYLSTMEPVMRLHINRSGINCCAVNTAMSDGLLLAIGGDDNQIFLTYYRSEKSEESVSLKELSSCSPGPWHCAQITGLQFVDNYLISASIDQRITLSRCFIGEDDVVECEFVKQFYTDVADVHGLEVAGREGDEVCVCVYGIGIELMCIKLPESGKIVCDSSSTT